MTDKPKTAAEILRAHQAAMDSIAHALGHLCIKWANLEIYVNQLFSTLMETPDDNADYAMIHCLDFRDQLSAIKVGAVAKTPTAVASQIISAMDYIDSVLRVRRNRYVHDRWDTEDGIPIRVNPAGKTFKLPGSGQRTWQRIEVSRDTITEIWDTTSEIAVHGSHVLILTSDLRDAPSFLHATPQIEPPPQRLSPPLPGTPRP